MAASAAFSTALLVSVDNVATFSCRSNSDYSLGGDFLFLIYTCAARSQGLRNVFQCGGADLIMHFTFDVFARVFVMGGGGEGS